MSKWQFESMSIDEAQRIVAASRRALRAILAGEKDSKDARAFSFQTETYDERLTAQRVVRGSWSPPPLRLELTGEAGRKWHEQRRRR